MAATCLDVVTYAMRQARVLGIGRAPKGAEAEEGMAALQSLYDQLRTGGMFGKLRDVYLTSDATAQEGRRYYVPAGVTLTDATNDYVPQSGVCDYDLNSDNDPSSYATDDCSDYGYYGGSIRQPRDLALYEVVKSDGTQTAKLYDRTQWVDRLDLQLTDIAPLSGRGVYGLAAALCITGGFTAAFGGEPSPAVIQLAANFTGSLIGKAGSSQAARTGEYM
jgi:hypothetical protein